MTVRVTAPLVIAKNEDGSFVHLYEGAILPDTLADGEEKRLADFLGDDEKSASSDDSGDEGYQGQKVDDLKAEIARRNEGREEADQIPSDGKKADLIAALEADDEK